MVDNQNRYRYLFRMSVDYFLEVLDLKFPGERRPAPDALSSVEHFIRDLGQESVMDAFHIACKKKLTRNDTLRYMFGICWNRLPKNVGLKDVANEG